ncbi:IucA/IucC family protein [Staphylococcus sp. NAM3COL9]|uniref:IucA/IucC family protein n=1 Tax=Staphylococcus sp. NAM3COL9 TaxID=1667172 RepID=UPI00070E9423|nr:IucA/IucC family protein [Staphylococcus sp. NAM3COL9]KRG08042.1 siderophore synthetase [Staphylococcus sp. NAM3COL9]
MMHETWQLADRNVQYRIINAMIKEQIFSDNMFFKEYGYCVEIQYKGQALQLNKTRKSAMERYEFYGEISYIKGKSQIFIKSLEELFEILETYFNISISSRLIDELLSSREGFALTYEHFEQRQSLIHATLKFSKMPETINFFSWLQHMVALEQINDLNYSESLVVEGHPTHPLSKTKLPLTVEEVKHYAPEFEKIIPLKVMLIHKAYCVTTSMEDDPEYMLNVVVPEYRYKLKAFIAPHELELNDYRVILIHPWQYDNVIAHKFADWIVEKRLLPTPFEVESKATLSFRTMQLIHKPFHIKLPVNIQATSAVRTVSSVTTVDGPKLSYELQDMLSIYPELQVAMEPFGIHAKTEPDIARHLACIVRHQPYIPDNGTTLVTASLVNKNPIDNNITVDSYLNWVSDGVKETSIKKFIWQYSKTLIEPLIAYIQDYGIALEAHMQNTIVNLGPNYQMKFSIRDLGGSRIDLTTLKNKEPNIDITNTSLIAENIDAVIAKFQHAVIQNQIAELIHHFVQYELVPEATLFEIVGDIVENAIDPNKAHAQKLKQVLFGPTITVKALLRMRMESKVKQYVTVDLRNPIYKEV